MVWVVVASVVAFLAAVAEEGHPITTPTSRTWDTNRQHLTPNLEAAHVAAAAAVAEEAQSPR